MKFLKQNCWQINKIEIYTDKILKNENLLNFENKKNGLFYMIKNDELHKIIKEKPYYKSKFFKRIIIKKHSMKSSLIKKNMI